MSRSTKPSAPQSEPMDRGGSDLNGGLDNEDDIRAVEKWRVRSKEWAASTGDSVNYAREGGPIDLDEDFEIVQRQRQEEMMANIESIEVADDGYLDGGEMLPRMRASPPGSDTPDVKPEESISSDLNPSSSLLDLTADEGDELDQMIHSLSERSRRSVASSVEESIISAVSTSLTPSKRQVSPKRKPGHSPRRKYSKSRNSPGKSRPPFSPPTPLQVARHPDEPRSRSTHSTRRTAGTISDTGDSRQEETRHRYLKACSHLKSTVSEHEGALLPRERSFLMSLVDENPENATEARISAIEAASATLTADPIFRTEHQQSSFSRPTPESDYGSPKKVWSSQGRDSPLTQPTATISDLGTALSLDSEEYPFLVLGADSSSTKPGVLTPALMEALRGFFPYPVSEENFWLKYSAPRDGAFLPSLVSKIRTSRNTIIGVETTTGHVFGAFCSSPWREQRSWYGKGDCFLWKLKSSRSVGISRELNYQNDNEMEVYPHTGSDDMIQLCRRNTLAVGGGDYKDGPCPYRGEPVGIGFMLDADLMGGETNSCATFANPRLGNQKSKESEFDVAKLEVWTLTPAGSIGEAQKLEMHRHFINEQR